VQGFRKISHAARGSAGCTLHATDVTRLNETVCDQFNCMGTQYSRRNSWRTHGGGYVSTSDSRLSRTSVRWNPPPTPFQQQQQQQHDRLCSFTTASAHDSMAHMRRYSSPTPFDVALCRPENGRQYVPLVSYSGPDTLKLSWFSSRHTRNMPHTGPRPLPSTFPPVCYAFIVESFVTPYSL
jgi:hypothetical protein